MRREFDVVVYIVCRDVVTRVVIGTMMGYAEPPAACSVCESEAQA